MVWIVMHYEKQARIYRFRKQASQDSIIDAIVLWTVGPFKSDEKYYYHKEKLPIRILTRAIFDPEITAGEYAKMENLFSEALGLGKYPTIPDIQFKRRFESSGIVDRLIERGSIFEQQLFRNVSKGSIGIPAFRQVLTAIPMKYLKDGPNLAEHYEKYKQERKSNIDRHEEMRLLERRKLELDEEISIMTDRVASAYRGWVNKAVPKDKYETLKVELENLKAARFQLNKR